MIVAVLGGRYGVSVLVRGSTFTVVIAVGIGIRPRTVTFDLRGVSLVRVGIGCRNIVADFRPHPVVFPVRHLSLVPCLFGVSAAGVVRGR
ncbi:MAG: hypothetical protein HY875_04645 [Chloroflexi bacterium]|nr:hypothetical protein [Chloroflexota bacterium]